MAARGRSGGGGRTVEPGAIKETPPVNRWSALAAFSGARPTKTDGVSSIHRSRRRTCSGSCRDPSTLAPCVSIPGWEPRHPSPPASTFGLLPPRSVLAPGTATPSPSAALTPFCTLPLGLTLTPAPGWPLVLPGGVGPCSQPLPRCRGTARLPGIGATPSLTSPPLGIPATSSPSARHLPNTPLAHRRTGTPLRHPSVASEMPRHLTRTATTEPSRHTPPFPTGLLVVCWEVGVGLGCFGSPGASWAVLGALGAYGRVLGRRAGLRGPGGTWVFGWLSGGCDCAPPGRQSWVGHSLLAGGAGRGGLVRRPTARRAWGWDR